MAENSKSDEPFQPGPSRPKDGVLRARDVIPPYGDAKREGKVVIPKFDLSREIMAPERKATAQKRQGPGEKTAVQEHPPEAHGRNTYIGPPGPKRAGEDRVLAEIVARDIARLCGMEHSGRR